MEQARLFRLAVEVLHFGAVFREGSGWDLSVVARRQDECWAEAYRAQYDHLSTAELVQLLEDIAAAQLL